MKTRAFRAAFPYTLPICVGFLVLGMSYGFLMGSYGFSFVYPMLMSLFIFAGSMEFVTANLLLMPTFQPLHAFLLTLMVNARHLFYGLSLLEKFRGLGVEEALSHLWPVRRDLLHPLRRYAPGGRGPGLVYVFHHRAQPVLLGGGGHLGRSAGPGNPF